MRTLQAVEVFDWYDGVVVGLGRLAGEEDTGLVSLLAYDAASRRRAYALVPLEAAEAAAVRGLRQDGLEPIYAELRALCATRTGSVRVAIVGDDGVVVRERVVGIDVVRGDLLLDIEAAAGSERAHWLGLGGGAEV
jgi:hypothetical protein